MPERRLLSFRLVFDHAGGLLDHSGHTGGGEGREVFGAADLCHEARI